MSAAASVAAPAASVAAPAASVAASAAPAASVASVAAPVTDRITALKAEIRDLKARCNACELELNKLEKVPVYIDRAIKRLIGAYGKNIRWQKKIHAILKEHLKSAPKYKTKFEMGKYEKMVIHSVDYIWDNTNYAYCHIDAGMGDYFTYFGHNYYESDRSLGNSGVVQDSCVEFSGWDDFNEFDMKYFPILIAYLEGELPLNEQ